MKLWDRIYRGMEMGFDSALSAVHTLTEKAGEGVEITLLRRERVRIETQLTKLLAELGNAVYEKISQNRLDKMAAELGVQEKIKELAEREARIVDIDTRLHKELDVKEEPEETEETEEAEAQEEEKEKN